MSNHSETSSRRLWSALITDWALWHRRWEHSWGHEVTHTCTHAPGLTSVRDHKPSTVLTFSNDSHKHLICALMTRRTSDNAHSDTHNRSWHHFLSGLCSSFCNSAELKNIDERSQPIGTEHSTRNRPTPSRGQFDLRESSFLLGLAPGSANGTTNVNSVANWANWAHQGTSQTSSEVNSLSSNGLQFVSESVFGLKMAPEPGNVSIS